jgi:hypothetical protein
MLTKYLEAAMRHAHCEILKEDGTYYGEIPECRGVYANAPSLDECRIVDHERGPGVKQYPAEALSSVILGCRIMFGNKQQIMQWCRARNPRPDIYRAQEKERQFGLDIIPVPWVPQ